MKLYFNLISKKMKNANFISVFSIPPEGYSQLLCADEKLE